MVKENKIKASKFLQWYFDSKEEVHYIGVLCVMGLKERGEYRVNAMQLFKDCEYIPSSICESYDRDNDSYVEYDPTQVEFINDIY